jgi:uncharacterized membrane protein YdjX (TVP38/TMEM64 family)
MASKTASAKSRAQSPGAKAKDDAPTPKPDAAKSGSSMKKHILAAVVVVVVAIAVFALVDVKSINITKKLEDAINFIEGQGSTAVLWYCAFTLIGVVCLIPTTPMELAGGFLFSPTYGIWMVLVFTGGTKLIANIISVLIARYVVRDWVHENLVKKYELLQMVSEAVKEEPWKMAFLVRGSMVPLCVKNYGLGVMEIGYTPIAACSMIFTNFYAFQNIYMGSTLQNLKDVFAPKKAADGPQGWDDYAKKIMPIAFNVLLIVFLVKAVKDQVKKQKAKIEAETREKLAGKKK